MDSNQYATELVTYLLVLVVYFYELIVYMLLERNAFDSIAFFLSVIVTIKFPFNYFPISYFKCILELLIEQGIWRFENP